MASGFFKRAMVYLGLVDDEYEEYEEYEPRVSVGPRLSQRVAPRRRGRAPAAGGRHRAPSGPCPATRTRRP